MSLINNFLWSLLKEFELRKHARQEGRRYCDPVVLTYQAERMPEQIRLKVRSRQDHGYCVAFVSAILQYVQKEIYSAQSFINSLGNFIHVAEQNACMCAGGRSGPQAAGCL